MTADLAYGFAITGADDVARSMQSVASQLERLTQRQQQNARAGRDMAQAGRSASQSFTEIAQTGVQFTQRLQGMAGAVQSLVTAMGSRDRTAGLVASVAGATAQFAAMGSMFGPGGTLIGGLAGLAVGVHTAADAMDDATTSAERYSAALETVRDNLAAAARRRRDARIGAGDTSGLSGEELEAEILARRERLGEIARERGSISSILGFGEDEEAMRREARSIREEIATLETAVADFRRNAEAGIIVDDSPVEFISPDDPRYTGRSSGRSGGARRAASTDGQSRGFGPQGDIGRPGENRIQDEMAAGQLTGQGSADATRLDEWRDAQEERARADRSFFDESIRAMTEWSESSASSLASVIAAYDRLSDASASSAREVARSGQLMARGIQGVASDIGTAVGTDMLGAFQSAVGAWLDGSKSFVEAAEEMAKGVLKALVQEGIVQAVAETARAIADLAGYRYDSAALHFAAAAAWGAVAGVAGGIGAATGAFGGAGAGAQEAAGSRELADRNQGDQMQGGTTIINLYPGGYITRDEVAGGMVDALNYAGRNGRTLDSRLLRGA